MGAGFCSAYDRLDTDEMSHSDEFPIFYGMGDHTNFTYYEVGEQTSDKGLMKMVKATITLQIALPKVILAEIWAGKTRKTSGFKRKRNWRRPQRHLEWRSS